MLSGLTSQIGTFIGKKTGGGGTATDPSVEQQPTTPETTTETTDLKDASQESGAAPAGSETSNSANILSSVRNHIPSFPSWLGGGKKPETEADPNAAPTTSVQPAIPKEDDGGSAATGTDAQQVSEEEAAAAGGPGNIEKVKNLGLTLFSTLKGAGQKIKETSILGDFQREHDSFLKSKGKGSDNALAPWVGHVKEEALKEEILSLSNDRRNFVRCPPPGINFAWDWLEYAPVAQAILKEDPNLENMRYTLVPKVITEENFWRNYFYRVQLLKESMDDTKPKNRRGSSSEEDDGGDADADLEKELNEELKSYEFVTGDVSKHDEKEIDSLLDLK